MLELALPLADLVQPLVAAALPSEQPASAWGSDLDLIEVEP